MTLAPQYTMSKSGEARGEQTPGETSENAATIMAEFEKAAASALNQAEDFIRANPITAAVGIGAAGALLALALTRRSSVPATLDKRLMSEINRHSEGVLRAVRHNANAFANSDTANAIQSFAENLAKGLTQARTSVAGKVEEMAK